MGIPSTVALNHGKELALAVFHALTTMFPLTALQ
jgi:hypothetical protein